MSAVIANTSFRSVSTHLKQKTRGGLLDNFVGGNNRRSNELRRNLLGTPPSTRVTTVEFSTFSECLAGWSNHYIDVSQVTGAEMIFALQVSQFWAVDMAYDMYCARTSLPTLRPGEPPGEASAEQQFVRSLREVLAAHPDNLRDKSVWQGDQLLSDRYATFMWMLLVEREVYFRFLDLKTGVLALSDEDKDSFIDYRREMHSAALTAASSYAVADLMPYMHDGHITLSLSDLAHGAGSSADLDFLSAVAGDSYVAG